MSYKRWIITLVLTFIPIVNLVFLCIWAFGKEDSRKNFSRAVLSIYSVVIGLSIVIGIYQAALGSDQVQYETEQTNSIANDIAAARESEETALKNDLEIINLKLVDGKIGHEVQGIIRNRSTSTTHSNFAVEFSIYGKEGAIIQSGRTIIKDSIPPGETYKFSEWQIHVDASSVKFKSISPKGIFE